MTTIEKRTQVSQLEVRQLENNAGLTVSGYAVRFNEPSQPLEYGFQEVIKPGAFTESLKTRNIVALHQHDDKQLLGSTQAKSLRLEERADGIYFELDLLETRKELYELVKRGDLANMSFGFTVADEKFNRNGNQDMREVRKGTLYEVSLVHTPAYPTSTVVAQRSLEQYEAFKKENDEPMTQQPATPAVPITSMQRSTPNTVEEVRAYKPGEKMGTESAVTIGHLIRAAVTGEGSKEVREMLNLTNTGGILVPHQIMANMIDLMRNQSFLLAGATTVNMGNYQTVSVPKVLSQPTVAFKKPGEIIPTSDPTFGEVKLEAKYLYGMVEVPLELLKTGIGVEEKLNYLIAQAMAETIEKAGLSGAENGFKGIFNDTDILTETFTAPTYLDIKKGVKKVATENGHANDLVFSTNNQLDVETQLDTTNAFLTPPAFYQSLTKHATNTMDDDHILIGDLTSIYVGVLQNTTVEVSTQHGFNKGTVAIRIMWWGDINVSEPKKLCLMTKAGA
ncbi:phage major capsid protein [Lysinibacillus sphaericus]|uniref:Prophage LambdaBa01, prohead protease n=3 Tax=Lysinibacillus sphaericus TaxID=1421 RepID=A0AAJ5A5W9_LYSSH|nr:phage major capsid protein [Lysinibacillus sphaericus]MED4546395.1 phage major capsid protein [Lysinibacillus sphaericus]GEC84543.1 hypothetical protein LSP03_42860 [Lysinibacillus sphaericus]SUX55542.1 putative prophage LambdaBa01, prohead protease [Lysinibacillus sphaericus]